MRIRVRPTEYTQKKVFSGIKRNSTRCFCIQIRTHLSSFHKQLSMFGVDTFKEIYAKGCTDPE